MKYTKKMQPLLAIILLVFIDQLSKYIIRSWGGFYICNRGVAFGIKMPEILILYLSITLILFLSYIIFNFQFSIFNKFPILKFSNFKLVSNFIRRGELNYPVILILSGAISNIIDRLRFGCVIDFIDLKIWPIFNFADIFITTGAIILLYQFRNSDIKKLFRN